MARVKRQTKLNKALPAFAEAKVGDVLNELITQVNALTSTVATLTTKLNNDAGVTDTNYQNAGTTVIKDLESR